MTATSSDTASMRRSRQPLLSIICPTYNHENFLAQTLDGFLLQRTNFPFEILVNDDASTDGTAAILASYVERHPDIIRPFYHETNQFQQGKTCTLELFNAARGRYIAYCEGDDYWTDPDKLQTQVDFLEAHRDYVITYHDAMAFDGTGDQGIQLQGKLRRDASAMELQKGRPISTLTACFRNVIHELPPELVNAPLGDICWWSLLGAHGKGKFLGQIKPAAYRVHPGGIFSMRSKKRKLHMSLQTCSALANYYHRLGNQALYEYFLVQLFGFSLSAISPFNKLQALGLVVRNVSINVVKRLLPTVNKSQI
jgi:glycosyltransferase involved in cell wall biosynthesis